jgi:hypothetical protein
MKLDDIPCFLIHREEDIIRIDSITELEKKLGVPLKRFEGISGGFLIKDGFPTQHPHEGITSAGNIGCTASHVTILEEALTSGYPLCCIFEDDAEVVGDLNEYLDSVSTLPPADIVFMGVNEIVRGEDTSLSSVKKVARFWGTHAVILTNPAILAILKTYKKYIDLGYALPADWLYSYAIKEYKLVAYAPKYAVIRQRPGFISLISGNIRK